MSGLFVRWEQRPVCLHGHDHIPVAHSCHAFYHCWGARITIKHCGPFLMFNPVTKVCDWPHTVKYIRPMCDPSYVKPPSNELKRVDLIKPTVNELGTYLFSFFDRKLNLAVLHVCFCLYKLRLDVFFFLLEYLLFCNWNNFLFLMEIFSFSEGKLISKCIFGIFNFSKKLTKNST